MLRLDRTVHPMRVASVSMIPKSWVGIVKTRFSIKTLALKIHFFFKNANNVPPLIDLKRHKKPFFTIFFQLKGLSSYSISTVFNGNCKIRTVLQPMKETELYDFIYI